MHDLGVNENTCRHNCVRNGQSGCNPVVKGFRFELCRDCIGERKHPNPTQCTRWPTIDECQLGCFYYSLEEDRDQHNCLASKYKLEQCYNNNPIVQ